MSDYWKKLKDPRWQKKRLEVFQRDNFTCRDCGDKERTQHVHHCFYEKGDPWNTGMEFLLTLCDECHSIRQDFENNCRKALGKIFTRTLLGDVVMLLESLENSKDPDPVIRSNNNCCCPDSFGWLCHGMENPKFRKTYARVTGRTVDWASLPST